MLPLCKILNTPVMSICLVKQNDGMWIEKHQRFLFNVYKRFFIFVTFFIISGTFFYIYAQCNDFNPIQNVFQWRPLTYTLVLETMYLEWMPSICELPSTVYTLSSVHVCLPDTVEKTLVGHTTKQMSPAGPLTWFRDMTWLGHHFVIILPYYYIIAAFRISFYVFVVSWAP